MEEGKAFVERIKALAESINFHMDHLAWVPEPSDTEQKWYRKRNRKSSETARGH